jgi:hypothetical protein
MARSRSTKAPVETAEQTREATDALSDLRVEEVPTAAAVSPPALLRFLDGWQQSLSGGIRAGEYLSIEYDERRLPPCRGYHGGMPGWDLWAHVRFHPGGQAFTGALVQHLAGDPPHVLDPPRPVACNVVVPLDANQVEMWFENTDAQGCRAWDSRYGANYWFAAQAGPASIPAQSVAYRWGAIPSVETVNVFSEAAVKKNVFPALPHGGPPAGTDLRTRLFVQAWVRNLSFTKYVWVDVHVFDVYDALIHSETFPLEYLAPAGGEGDFFVIDRPVYQGSVATPGSVSPRPDARKLQYRLYFETEGRLYSDAVLHQHPLPEDALTR